MRNSSGGIEFVGGVSHVSCITCRMRSSSDVHIAMVMTSWFRRHGMLTGRSISRRFSSSSWFWASSRLLVPPRRSFVDVDIFRPWCLGLESVEELVVVVVVVSGSLSSLLLTSIVRVLSGTRMLMIGSFPRSCCSNVFFLVAGVLLRFSCFGKI